MTTRKRKPTEKAKGASPAKRASKGRAAKKQDDPTWATENANSHMVNQNLHATYCDPQTYENWTKEDWEEIHDCLPENAPFNEDGYSVPMTYFKYDPDWRRLVREFQEDLGAGRYEPEWQKQATRAMEERAAGKFDKFKEDQFEAFWGQKQKVNADDRAGDSSKIKLADLVEAERIKIGDNLSFRRVFEKKGEGAEGKWMIEKEIKVVAIEGSSLIVAIPPGRTKYLKVQHSAASSQTDTFEQVQEPQAAQLGTSRMKSVRVPGNAHRNGLDGLNSQDAIENNPNGTSIPSEHEESPSNDPSAEILLSHETKLLPTNEASPGDSQQRRSLGPEDILHAEISQNGVAELEADQKVSSDATTQLASATEQMAAQGGAGDKQPPLNAETGETGKHKYITPPKRGSDTVDPETGCLIHHIKTIKSFVDTIIQVDGRLNPKDAPILSNWRLLRLERNNQDLGSLFDLREELYVWNSHTIVKTPKKNRGARKLQVEDKAAEALEERTQRKRKVSAKKRAADGDSPFTGKPEGIKSPGGVGARSRKNKHSMGGSDEDNTPERDSDGDFDANKSRSSKAKLRDGSKRPSKRLRSSPIQDDDVTEKEENNGAKIISVKVTAKAHLCPHCGNGFTTEWSLNRHVKSYCKSNSKA